LSESADSNDHLVDGEVLDTLSSYEVPLLLRRNTARRFMLVRTDVIHSLGLPALGVKLDSSPGRIRATLTEVSVPGIFLGSCYELCGSGHRAIPIHVLVAYLFKLDRLRAFKALRKISTRLRQLL